MQKKRIAEANKAIGKPKVGGSFELVDHNGNPYTDADMKGRYSLVRIVESDGQIYPIAFFLVFANRWCLSLQVYFGFTHCPDICPEELDKMADMYELVEQRLPGTLNAIFVTCDPARDGPAELKTYLAEFHPKFVGLTGTYDEIKAMCKAYRVYFSTPSQVKPGQDYLVDHSIYFYVMDPEGNFVEALGRQHSPKQAADIITGHIKTWEGEMKKA